MRSRAGTINGQFGQKFSVAGMRETGAIKHAFGDWVCDNGSRSSGPNVVNRAAD